MNENAEIVRLAKELLQTLKALNIALSEHLSNAEYQEIYQTKLDIELALDL